MWPWQKDQAPRLKPPLHKASTTLTQLLILQAFRTSANTCTLWVYGQHIQPIVGSGTGTTGEVFDGFRADQTLNFLRDVSGADLIALVHNWTHGGGVGSRPGYASLTNQRHLPVHTLAHELGHNFGRSIMPYGALSRTATWGARATNMWTNEEHALFDEANYGTQAGRCADPDDTVCCTELSTTTSLSYAHDRMASLGGSRIAPTIVRNLALTDSKVCTSDIRGIGLKLYEKDGKHRGLQLVLLCRESSVRTKDLLRQDRLW